MGAPKYNEYWKKRTKSGRDKIFSSGDEIIDKFQDYIEYCDNNPIGVNEMIKAGQRAGEIIKVPRPLIPSFKGFAIFCGVDEHTLYTYLKSDSHKDFNQPLTYIKDILSANLLENGVTGEANSMLVARLLKLTDRTDITSDNKAIGIGTIEFKAATETEQQEINELKQAMKESTTNK